MTVAATTNRKTYTGDNVTTSFATSPVIFYATSDLQVRVTVIATGVSTLLTLNTHYTVSGGSAAGAVGTVSLAGGSSPHGALLSTEKLVILRVLPLTQGVDFVNNNNSDAEVIETAFDKLTDVDQQLSERQDRALTFAEGEVSVSSTQIAGVAARADQVLGFDSNGNLTYLPKTTSVTDASTISTVAAGVSAVTRTLRDKGRDVVSVFDYMIVAQIADVRANTALLDVTTAINAAIAACILSGQALYFPAGTYLVTSQLTAIPGQFLLFGDGRQRTTFLFRPTVDNVACFKFSNGAAQVINCFMRDVGIKSDDTTHTKIGIDLYDLSTCEFANIYIYGTGTGTPSAPYFTGNTSIGIRTHGRDTTTMRDLEIIADKPISIAANPNTAANLCEDMDHWHWSNLYLIPKGNYAITVADGLGVQDTTFDGFQAWVGGTGGFYMNDTRAAPTVYSYGLTFKNVRGEQGQDVNGYWFNINAAFRVGGIGFENILGGVGTQGIKIDRVLKLDLERVTMATAAGKDSLKVTTPDSDSVITMRNCEWQLSSVFTLTNYTAVMIAAFNATDFQGPNTAVYVANTNQVGTLWNGGGVTAHVVATLPALAGSANGGGDRFKLAPGAAGNGMNQIIRDDGDTAYAPQLFSNSYSQMLNKIYPGSDAGAFQSVAGIYAGNGVPNNANGANGDFYFRGDGTQAGNTVIYHKQVGAWVALITT